MSSAIREREDVFRKRLCQLDKSGRAPPDTVIIEVTQTKAIAKYYKGAGTIDPQNWIRADKLRMDCNLATKHWDKRFNFGVLGIICIDAYHFYQQVVRTNKKKTSCLEFFCKLAEELINNNEGICMTRAAAEQDVGGGSGTPPLHQRLISGGPFGCHRLGGRLIERTSLLYGHLGYCGILEGSAIGLVIGT